MAPPCSQGRTNCFAYSKGSCAALNNTVFGKKCPFYKPDGQRRKELKERENR